MMKYIHTKCVPGGIEVLMPKLINALDEYDISVFVLRPNNDSEVNLYHKKNIQVDYGSKYNILLIIKLYIYAFKNRKSIFHIFNLGPIFLIILQLAGVKNIIYSIRGTLYWKTNFQKYVRKPLWKLSFYGNCIFIANSYYSRKCFVNSVGYKKNIQIIYNPIATKKYISNKKNKNNNEFKIIYCGRLNSGKNLFYWLDCAKEIHKKYSNAKFILYGDGPLKEKLIEYCDKIGLKSNTIEFAGYHSDINKAYYSADLLLFLSEYESFGNVVVESILCGTPVLTSNIPSMREIFINYPEFIIEDMNDPIPIILSKISNINQLNKKANLAKAEFEERFSLDQHVNKLHNIYTSLK